MRNDFGHANDLAEEHPDKLAELQALFDTEAHKYNVYPMANDFNEIVVAERPRLVSGDMASYGPGTIRLPEDAAINIKNRSSPSSPRSKTPRRRRRHARHPRRRDRRLRPIRPEGKPTFQYNWLGLDRYTITATEPLPEGECTIRFDFAYDGGGPGKGGTGTLSVNGTPSPTAGSTTPSPSTSRPTTPRRGRGLGHTDVTHLRAPVHLHRHTEEGDRARQGALNMAPPATQAA